MAVKRTGRTGRGRPSHYSHALAERICERVANGSSLRKAAEAEGVPWGTVWKWLGRHESFGGQYARAREARLDLLEGQLEDLKEAAMEAASDFEGGRLRMEAIKLNVDTLKWQLCKLRPHCYGERRAVEVTGAQGEPLLPPHTQAELETFARLLAEARARIDGAAGGAGAGGAGGEGA